MKITFQTEPEPVEKQPEMEESRLLQLTREHLQSCGVDPSLYGIGTAPPGQQDGCGAMLYKDPDGLWVVCQVVRYRKRYPAFFTDIYDAIDYFVVEMPGMTKGLDLRSSK